MHLYIFFSWATCLFTFVCLILIFLKRKHWFFRPSLQIVLWFNLLIQWGGAVKSKYIFFFLPFPWHYFLITSTIPLLIIAYNIVIGNLWVTTIWEKIGWRLHTQKKGLRRFLWFFIFCIVVVNIYYLFKIPFQSTGLFNLFANSSTANLAREESLKLVSDPFIRYGYSLVIHAIAPIAAAIMILLFLQREKKSLMFSFIFFICFLYILIVVTLPGSRGGPAGVILCVLLAIYISKRMPIKILYFLLGLLGVLLIPVMITILREGRGFSLNSLFEFFSYLFQRVFVSPMETGVWHMHYAQTHGVIGVEGIRPLAFFFGKEYISLSNIVGLIYADNPLKTISANTGFFFDYYACFGLSTIMISAVLTFILDITVLFLKRCDILLIPLLSLMFFKTINFVESGYTVTLMTHGFLLIPVLALVSSVSIKMIKQKQDEESQIFIKV